MKRLKYLLMGLLLALPFLASAALVHAQSFRTGTNVTVAQSETLNRTLFVSGRTLDIAGTVNGDVFCAGQNITVSGTVNGDLICAGQSLSVSGTVNGDVRLAGQDVIISGQVTGNASVGGQTLTLDSRGKIAGDLSTAAQTATLNGTVGRDVAFATGSVAVNNTVGRDINAQVGTLTLGAGARVAGNVHYTSENSLTRSQGAVVGGTISHSTPKAKPARAGAVFGLSLVMALYMFVSFLLIALTLVLIVPRAFHAAAESARGNLLKTFFVGFVASIIVPVLLVALLFTVVGIPLAFFAGLAWLVIVLLSGPFAAYLLGRLLLRHNSSNAIWTMLLGGVVLLLLYLVPFLGVITSMLALWFGLGTILTQTTSLPKPHYNMATVAAKKK
ncbi:MAG: polymer-forming cytoskeletal protein [Candidatus Saccharimonadales bacterium]